MPSPGSKSSGNTDRHDWATQMLDEQRYPRLERLHRAIVGAFSLGKNQDSLTLAQSIENSLNAIFPETAVNRDSVQAADQRSQHRLFEEIFAGGIGEISSRGEAYQHRVEHRLMVCQQQKRAVKGHILPTSAAIAEPKCKKSERGPVDAIVPA